MAFQIRQKSDSVVSALAGSSQDFSCVSALANGGWVVTWQSNEAGSYDIYQSVYAADGTLAVDASNNVIADQEIVTSAPNNQQVSAVTGLAGGGWVVIWETIQNNGTTDLRQAVYRPDGSFAGETVVSSAGNSQAAPSASALPGGGYVLVWQTKENGNSDIHQRTYDANGAPVGAETVVSEASSNQTAPSVTVLSNGGWVVTWETQGAGGTTDIHQRAYNPNGTPVGPETAVSEAANNQYAPSVTALPGGGWVVTWQTDEASNGGADIHQRVYKADGTLVGNEITVTEAANTQSAPVVTALFDDPDNPNDGGWVVVWQTDEAGTGNFDIRQRVYKADGTPLFEEEVVSQAANNQSLPSVTALAGGGWVVTWRTDEAAAGSFDIRQRVYGVLTAGADEVIGDGADDTFTVAAAAFSPDDSFDGGLGLDTLILSGGGLFDFTTGVTVRNFEALVTTEAPLTTQYKGVNASTAVKLSNAAYTQFQTFDAKAGAFDAFEITDASLNDPQRAALFAQGFEVVYDNAGGPYYDPAANKPTFGMPPAEVLEDSGPVQITITRSVADDTDATATSHYKIDAITGGTLYLDADATQEITAGSFIALAGKDTNVYFKLAENFFGEASFSVTASKSDTDTGLGPSATATATFSVTPVNDAPTDITLTGNTVREAAPVGTVVGKLTGVDVDGPDGHVFTLLNNAGGRFALVGNQIVVKNGVLLDHEQAKTHAITVRLTDGTFVQDKVLLVSVSNMSPEYVVGTTAANVLVGDVGRDRLYGGYGNDRLKGAGNNDTLKGDAGNDLLYGGSHNDLLYGGAGRDYLMGETGNDRLWGGLNNDTLRGGTGKDIFVFDTKLGTATTDRTVNLDTITDFSVPYDTIWLDNAIFRKLGSGSLSSPRKLNSKFFTVGDAAKDLDDYVIYNSKTGYLSYDADGSGAGKAVEFARVKAGLKMTYADFCVV